MRKSLKIGKQCSVQLKTNFSPLAKLLETSWGQIIYSDNENEKYEQFVKQVSRMVIDYIDKNQKMKGEKN
ncbi:hypothetical protein DLD52_00860 [Bacillus subtilis]|nr:hypothetical protein DS740_10970 [Bacillus sp. DM2]PWT21798.1 hypothetical protein DLD52_00860 [Bacillus subtilis]